ncbi:MAG: DUF86 domain-containing protein [Parcubacteria group bacterium]|nr:DUF86 domain-containing protein [Parcubacteria group bacterium]
MANQQIILSLLSQLRDYLSKMKSLEPQVTSWKTFEKDWEKEWQIDRGLQLLIECSIDIGKEIITGLEIKKPTTYQEVFIILRQTGVVSEDTSKKMQDLAVFRNELVHDYLYLDREKIYNVFKNDLKYFERYLLEIGGFLKKIKPC